MKIAFLAGANTIHSVRWIQYFADHNHEIHWISLAPSGSEATGLIQKVHFYEIKPSPLADINGAKAFWYIPKAISQVKNILKKVKPDVLHVHSIGTYGVIGAMTDFQPMVVTPWGTDVLLPSRWKKPIIRRIIKKAVLLTCDGENTFKKLIEFGAEKTAIHFIRFGTDIDRFCPSIKRKLTKRPFTIVSLRGLEPTYDIETLLRAAACVAQQILQARFLIAGDGSQKSYLKCLAEKLDLTKNVKFVGKLLPVELPNFLQSADIYVSTALSDSGLAASTTEAMACALPVVVTDSGDNRMWVHEGKGGYVVPIRNPELLAEKIMYLLQNKGLQEIYGKYNRHIVEEHNNYYKEMEKVEKLYETLAWKH